LLPASVIREVVNDNVEEIEEEEGRKERQSIRDEVIQDLLPKAFTRSRDTYAYLDTNGDANGGGWLLVDSAARSRAEDLSVLLRECLGTLPIGIPKTQRNPAEAMTEWLRTGAAPAGFAITDECELREPAEGGGVVRCASTWTRVAKWPSWAWPGATAPPWCWGTTCRCARCAFRTWCWRPLPMRRENPKGRPSTLTSGSSPKS
jgi:hypothetical protein